MTTSRLNNVLRHLRDDLVAGGPSDGQMLERFLARRDETAFDALVRRHGPMVLGVCRRVLRNTHDAEDAFQATFLVLVSKAASVRPRELVGHWLYGVAYRTALKARSLAAKRSAKERKMPFQETHHDEPPADWLPLLDEELQRLPDKYRLPLVLCDLDGKTRKEAARQLGWADGTLSTRLTRARVLLAERLTRRGVALAGGAAALAILNRTASAQVSAALATSTVKAAMGFAAGHAATMVSANVAALTQGVLKTMLLTKLKTVLAIGLVLAVVGFGVGAGAFRNAADAQGPPPPAIEPSLPPTTVETTPPAPSAKLSVRPLPAPALVSLTRTGTVGVTTRYTFYQPVTTTNGKGQPVTSFRLVDQTTTDQYSREDVHVYDTAGKLVPTKEVSRLLKDEVTALVYNDGGKPDPLHLKLFKEGTLILVLPAPKPVPAAPVAEVPPNYTEPKPAQPPVRANSWIDWPILMPPATAPLPPPAPEKAPTPNEETMKLYQELQGEWRLVSSNSFGPKGVPEELKKFRLDISHDNVVRTGLGADFERTKTPRMTLLVSPGSPNNFDLKTTDVDDDAKVALGIYKLKGDELTVRLAPPGAERPRTFELPDGSKHQLFVFQRVVPNEKPR